MKNRIGMITKEHGYLERLASYLMKKHGDELLIYHAEKIEDLIEQTVPDMLHLLVAEKEPELPEVVKNFPRLVYLTDVREENAEREICKYQRAEEIYEEILEWAHFFSKGEKNGSVRQDNVVVRTYGADEVPDMAAMEMLACVGEKLGLLIPEVRGQAFFYDIRGCVSLEKYLENTKEEQKRRKLAGQLCMLLSELEEYLLTPDCVWLEKEHMYYEEKTESLKMLYVPLENGKSLSQATLCQVVEAILLQPFAEKAVDSGMEEGGTCVFQNLQMAAKQSRERILRRKAGETTVLIETELPHLIRKKNQEKIEICGNIFKIGKDKKYVDYCITDNPAISKSHADIVKQGDTYFLLDQHSLNATLLNGRKIPPKEPVPLHVGDSIVFADEQFDFYQ